MRAALGFLTVVGGAAPPDRRAPAWFGAIGALVGLAVGGAWWLAGEVWPPLLAAVVAVAADAALTGMLHLDGLADTADGLLPPVGRERRLAIMATPDIGAFGVVAVLVVLLARVGALAGLAPDPLLVAGLWAGSRAAMALTMARVPYARPRGAASGFAGGAAAPAGAGGDGGRRGEGEPGSGRHAEGRPGGAPGGGRFDQGGPGGEPGGGRHGDRAPGSGRVGRSAAGRPALALPAGASLAVACAVVVAARGGWAGAATAAGLVAGFAVVVVLAVRRVGGYTGDVLGAAGVVAETVGLAVAAARW